MSATISPMYAYPRSSIGGVMWARYWLEKKLDIR